jgi:SAM-dependent methyltransferase
MRAVNESWPLQLFRKSVLKQRKFAEIATLLGKTDGLHCLDIGADNGVISYLLRRRGGTWKSADLDAQAIQSIRELVKCDVFQIDGRRTPFCDSEFDRVVIVDFLEHIHTDGEFVAELFRIIKPGGELIINVPHAKDSLLRKFRLTIGQTDEKHGHVRPGYTVDGLTALLMDKFIVLSCKTYSKFFSELIDTFITFGFNLLKKEKVASQKGTIVTGQDLCRHQKVFSAYSFIYPAVWFFAKMDMFLFWHSGYMLIMKAKINKTQADNDSFYAVQPQIGKAI